MHNKAICSIQKQDINLGSFMQLIWIAYTEFHWQKYRALKYTKADNMECCINTHMQLQNI
jgi:hypothetical protein